MNINLLPPKYQPKPLIEWKRLKKQLFISLIFFILFWSGNFYYFYRSEMLADRLNYLKQSSYYLEPLKMKVLDYQNVIDKTKEIDAFEDKVNKERIVWSKPLSFIVTCVDNNIKIDMMELANNKIIINGKALDYSDIANFSLKLRNFAEFKSVNIDLGNKIEDTEIIENSDLYNHDFKISKDIKFTISIIPILKGGE